MFSAGRDGKDLVGQIWHQEMGVGEGQQKGMELE
jgi:hypothetical protein